MEAAATNITKSLIGTRRKSPCHVLKDADLDLAVKSILASRVGNTGQICNCAERVYVHSSLKDAFIEKMTAAMKGVRYGNPAEAEPGTLEMGPLIEERAVKAVAEKVETRRQTRCDTGLRRQNAPKDAAISSNRPC